MDQLASLAGSRNRALLSDCRSFEIEHIPLPPRLAVLVIDSGMPRQLVDSAYSERRRACELADERLGLTSLRDATPEQVEDDPTVVEAAAGRYWAETGQQPRGFVCRAVEGAGRVE